MENNNYCFVIQPIKDTKFTKRYKDVYAPAIATTRLVPYRVDLDTSVRNIIDEIEKKIADASICLADISMDNPNVWYELGYAFAIGKDVVMVCDESRNNFPFDISHKSIIKYTTESSSDFSKLKDEISNKIKAYIASGITKKKLIENPIKSTEGLQSYEIALLAYMIGEQITDEQDISVYLLKEQMNRSGFNEIATSIGIRLLQRKQFIETSLAQDWGGNEYNACKLTSKGIDFILNNINLFNLGQKVGESNNIDDLPF
jgi:hypothetical protein